ncbi:MAG: hypothetical protein KAJ51_07780, partial [Thermoplasmata archaeon]|nr:hypothetical protein [Thermoplasmata archaeon]
DLFGEIITTAINFGYAADPSTEKIYIFSIKKGPRIRMRHPSGGETLSGSAIVNATVSDPDENINNALGIYFYYSTDLSEWTLIDIDKTPGSIENIYETTWDTTSLPDGSNYYVKGWVRDLDNYESENISSPITIDNLHPPELTIIKPTQSDELEGTVDITALVVDSELDNIGGGINTTRGVKFYFSTDNTNWDLFSTEYFEEQDNYTASFDTTPYPDGEYWVKVNATDWDGFEVEKDTKIVIDNPPRPPSLLLLTPSGGSNLSGKVVVSASSFDFDGDINSSGVTFFIMSDTIGTQGQYIGNDPTFELNGTDEHIYSFEWDTTTVSDHWYQLKAFVNDTEGLNNESMSTKFRIR